MDGFLRPQPGHITSDQADRCAPEQPLSIDFNARSSPYSRINILCNSACRCDHHSERLSWPTWGRGWKESRSGERMPVESRWWKGWTSGSSGVCGSSRHLSPRPRQERRKKLIDAAYTVLRMFRLCRRHLLVRVQATLRRHTAQTRTAQLDSVVPDACCLLVCLGSAGGVARVQGLGLGLRARAQRCFRGPVSGRLSGRRPPSPSVPSERAPWMASWSGKPAVSGTVTP